MADKKVPSSFAEAEDQRSEEIKQAEESRSASKKSVDIAQFNKVSEELEKYKAKAEDNWERLLRKEAELRNVESRAQASIDRERKYALEKIFKEILTVLDGFDGGMESINNAEDIASAKEGMDLIHTLFVDTLAKFGLELIAAEGKKFDPNMHEAMTMLPTDDIEPNTVAQVIQKGYILNGKVIRPARVIVAKATS